MKKSDTRSAILRGLYHYVLFFLLVAFLVSSTMSLFVSTLSAIGSSFSDEKQG